MVQSWVTRGKEESVTSPTRDTLLDVYGIATMPLGGGGSNRWDVKTS